MANHVLLNTNIYGDRQSSSSLPVRGRPAGDPIWERPSSLVETAQPVVLLALADSVLIVSYPGMIEIRKCATGEIIWQRKISGNALFDLKPEGLVTLNHAGHYQLLSVDQKLTAPLSLPFLSSNTVLYYSRRMGDEMLYCYLTVPTPTNSPGDISTGPNLALYRFSLQSDAFVWQFRRPEGILMTLESRDGSTVGVATSQNIYLMPSDAKSDSVVTTLSFPRLLSCSYNAAGELLAVVGKPPEEGGVTLKVINARHETLHERSFGQVEVSVQPPASSPDGLTYLMIDGKVQCLRESEILWAVPMPAGVRQSQMTILSDGSVLVVSGQTLLQLSSNGDILLRKPLKSAASCRPIMDSQGRVYLAGIHTVMCIE